MSVTLLVRPLWTPMYGDREGNVWLWDSHGDTLSLKCVMEWIPNFVLPDDTLYQKAPTAAVWRRIGGSVLQHPGTICPMSTLDSTLIAWECSEGFSAFRHICDRSGKRVEDHAHTEGAVIAVFGGRVTVLVCR